MDEAEKRRNHTEARVRCKVEWPSASSSAFRIYQGALSRLNTAPARKCGDHFDTFGNHSMEARRDKMGPANSSQPMVLKGSAAAAIVVKLKSKGKPKALTGPQTPWIVDPRALQNSVRR